MLYLWLERNRVASASFPYDLTLDELRAVIAELRKAGNGLERWIVPGLEENQASGTVQHDHPERYAALPELLESCRDLPVAEPWLRRRQALQVMWAKQLVDHPEDIAKVPAPWLLPAGYGSERSEGTPARRSRATTNKATKPRKRRR